MGVERFVQITRREKTSEEEFSTQITEMYNYIWENLLPQQILTADLSHRVTDNVITPEDAPVPDCRECGACCACFPYIGVRPTENVPERHFLDVTVEGTSGEVTVDRFLRRKENDLTCAALEGELGSRVGCGIYENRPRVCRDFEPGSDKCHAARRAYGFEPPLGLMEMAVALRKLKNAPDRQTLSPTSIKDAKIREQPDSELLEITALFEDGTLVKLHEYDPRRQTFRQFEFFGLTLRQAQDLIATRKT